MGVLQYLFSFKGRISRAKLWLWVGVSFAVQVAGMIAGLRWPVLLDLGFISVRLQHSAAAMLRYPVPWFVWVLLFWPSAALAVKRLHDRDKGAVWLLLFWGVPFAIQLLAILYPALSPHMIGGHSHGVWWFIPLFIAAIVVGFWAFLELYCFAGSFGQNRFGPDPLGGQPNLSRVFPDEPSHVEKKD